mmetsp:Transcript_10926/g.17179  ORF Transcript_10926/g.17179 Transcript_10926/m.17179 type:complete len:149 (+) Transcript_10926:212-658(+)
MSFQRRRFVVSSGPVVRLAPSDPWLQQPPAKAAPGREWLLLNSQDPRLASRLSTLWGCTALRLRGEKSRWIGRRKAANSSKFRHPRRVKMPKSTATNTSLSFEAQATDVFKSLVFMKLQTDLVVDSLTDHQLNLRGLQLGDEGFTGFF